ASAAGSGGDSIDIYRRAGHRAVGDNAARRSRHQPAQFDLRLRHDVETLWFAARDEFVDLAKRARMVRGLTMVDRAQHEIGRAFQRRDFRRHAGRHARLADEAAIGLGIFVDTVAAQREECGAVSHFAFTLVQTAQERAAAVELTTEAVVPLIDAVVGNAA